MFSKLLAAVALLAALCCCHGNPLYELLSQKSKFGKDYGTTSVDASAPPSFINSRFFLYWRQEWKSFQTQYPHLAPIFNKHTGDVPKSTYPREMYYVDFPLHKSKLPFISPFSGPKSSSDNHLFAPKFVVNDVDHCVAKIYLTGLGYRLSGLKMGTDNRCTFLYTEEALKEAQGGKDSVTADALMDAITFATLYALYQPAMKFATGLTSFINGFVVAPDTIYEDQLSWVNYNPAPDQAHPVVLIHEFTHAFVALGRCGDEGLADFVAVAFTGNRLIDFGPPPQPSRAYGVDGKWGVASTNKGGTFEFRAVNLNNCESQHRMGWPLAVALLRAVDKLASVKDNNVQLARSIIVFLVVQASMDVQATAENNYVAFRDAMLKHAKDLFDQPESHPVRDAVRSAFHSVGMGLSTHSTGECPSNSQRPSGQLAPDGCHVYSIRQSDLDSGILNDVPPKAPSMSPKPAMHSSLAAQASSPQRSSPAAQSPSLRRSNLAAQAPSSQRSSSQRSNQVPAKSGPCTTPSGQQATFALMCQALKDLPERPRTSTKVESELTSLGWTGECSTLTFDVARAFRAAARGTELSC